MIDIGALRAYIDEALQETHDCWEPTVTVGLRWREDEGRRVSDELFTKIAALEFAVPGLLNELDQLRVERDGYRKRWLEQIDVRVVRGHELAQLREDNAVLRGQVARVEAWYGWRRGTDAPNEALAIPAEGGAL